MADLDRALKLRSNDVLILISRAPSCSGWREARAIADLDAADAAAAKESDCGFPWRMHMKRADLLGSIHRAIRFVDRIASADARYPRR